MQVTCPNNFVVIILVWLTMGLIIGSLSIERKLNALIDRVESLETKVQK